METIKTSPFPPISTHFKATLASITKLPIQQYHLCRLDSVQLGVRGLDVEIQGNRQSRKFKAPDFVESHSNRTTICVSSW